MSENDRTPDDAPDEPTVTTPSDENSMAVEPVAEPPSEAGPELDEGSEAERAVAAQPEPQVVYVPTPLPPKKKGARGVGVVVALVGSALFTVVYALLAVIFIGIGGPASLAERFSVFAATPSFWMPVVAFLVGYVLLVLVINRAGWWAHVLGGFLVALLVYVVFLLSTVLSAGAVGAPAEQVQQLLRLQLTNPLGWAAAIAAREVPIWVGGLVARRGRTVKTRNAEAHEAYERELAELRARSGAPAV